MSPYASKEKRQWGGFAGTAAPGEGQGNRYFLPSFHTREAAL
jgi:hypothetical protein